MVEMRDLTFLGGDQIELHGPMAVEETRSRLRFDSDRERSYCSFGYALFSQVGRKLQAEEGSQHAADRFGR